jgi:hypothetical protein
MEEEMDSNWLVEKILSMGKICTKGVNLLHLIQI